MFGIIDDQENLFINHILLIAKKYLYSCRYSETKPSIKVLTAKIKRVHQLETTIAKSSSTGPPIAKNGASTKKFDYTKISSNI